MIAKIHLWVSGIVELGYWLFTNKSSFGLVWFGCWLFTDKSLFGLVWFDLVIGYLLTNPYLVWSGLVWFGLVVGY